MGTLRSKTGCHTCRLRKKKCDEAKPSCSNCVSRDMPCLGYGTRPIARPEDDAQILALKHAAERRYKVQRAPWKAAEIAASSQYEVDIKRIGCLPPGKTRFEKDWRSQEHGMSKRKDDFSIEGLPIRSYDKASLESRCISQRGTNPMDAFWWDSSFKSSMGVTRMQDTELLRYFVLNIFPIQFIFYPTQSSSSLIGNVRSWALDLTSRSKVMNDAIVMRSTSLKGEGNVGKEISKSFMERKIDCMKSLRLHILNLEQAVDDVDITMKVVESLCCITSLIANEEVGTWEMHLQAERTILDGLAKRTPGRRTPFSSYNLKCVSGTSPHAMNTLDHALRTPNFLSTTEIRALQFFVEGFVWMDTISSATFGQLPSMLNSYDYIPILEDGCIDMSLFMGCENWVIVAIRKVVKLEDEINTQSRIYEIGTDVYAHLEALQTIENSLQDGLRNLHFRMKCSLGPREESIVLLTEVFCYAALVHLRVTFPDFVAVSRQNSPTATDSSPHENPNISDLVTRGLIAVDEIPLKLLVRSAWVLCVLGCMAGSHERDFVRNIENKASIVSQKSPPIDSELNNPSKVSRVYSGAIAKTVKMTEECWRLQDGDLDNRRGLINWRDAAIGLGERLLLA